MAEKRVKRKYCVEDLAQAVEDIKSKRRSLRDASSFYKIPRATLAEKATKEIIVPTRYGPKGILSDAEEENLMNYINKSKHRAYPTTRDDVLNWVESILKEEAKEGRRRKLPTGCVDLRPGKTWWKNFKTRHPEIFIMSPVSLSRAKRVVTETSIHQWFYSVREYLCEEKCVDVLTDPSRNFHMDEICFSVSPTTGKVNNVSGSPDAFLAWVTARLMTISVLATVAADGKVPPPVVVFPRKRLSNKIIESRPSHLDCSLGSSNSGCMTIEQLCEYLLNTFDPWLVRNNITKPVILWADWHETRVSYHLTKELQERQIIMYGLPPGTKPLLQPLEVSVFAQLKMALRINTNKWRKENPMEKLDQKTFLRYFLPLYYEICTADIINAGFKRCGIHPFDSAAPDYSILDTKKYIPRVEVKMKNIKQEGVSGRGVSGRGVSGRGVSGRGVSGRGVSGRGVSGRGVSGRGVSGRGVSGRGGSGRGVSGRGVSGRGGSGRGVSSRGGVVSIKGGVVSSRGRLSNKRGRPRKEESSSIIPSDAVLYTQVDPFLKNRSDDDTGLLSQKHLPYLTSKISTKKLFQPCNDTLLSHASRCPPNFPGINFSPVQKVDHLDTSCQSDVSCSPRLRKKSSEVPDVGGPDGNCTFFKRKADQPNRSPKRMKMGQCVGAEICRLLESCINRDFVVVKEEPLAVDDQEDDSVSFGGDSFTEYVRHSDDNANNLYVGEEANREDPLHTANDSTNFACKKSNTNEPCRPLTAALRTTPSPDHRQARRKIKYSSVESNKEGERQAYNICHLQAFKEEEAVITKTIGDENLSNVSTRRGAHFGEMEDVLYLWIQNQHRKNIPVDGTIIIEKATQLQTAIDKKNGASGISFSASSGWLNSFKKRHGLNIVMSAAVPSHLVVDHTATSSHPNDDNAASLSYPTQFAEIIKEGGYSPEQVFTANETVLFWKRLPNKTFLMKEEKAASGFKASDDYLTLLFCSNAARDFKLPPLLVYRTLRPQELQNVTCLPVVWRANSKAWMTSAIFVDWYQQNFIPAVNKYLKSRNLPSKAILFVHSSPSHPQALKGIADHDGYRLEFFLPDTSSLLQPLNQGVIAQIKKLYTKQVLWEMFLYTEGKGNGRKGVVEFWKKFNIRNAISIIIDSWETVESPCHNDAWEKLWPEIMFDFHGFLDTQTELPIIVKIANNIPGKGFGDLVAEDIMEHLESRCNIPTPEEVLELSTEEADEGQNDDSEAATSEMPLSAMRQFVDYMNSGLEIADSDPNFRRASVAVRQIRQVCEVYIRSISAQLPQKKMRFF